MIGHKLHVAFGPVMEGVGSWHWLGEDLAAALQSIYHTSCWQRTPHEDADVVIFVKYPPPADVVRELAKSTAVLYFPVDCFGSVVEIEIHRTMLRSCDRVVVHSPRLARYFTAFSTVALLDHHVKYVVQSIPFRTDGPILWVGMRSHLPVLANWVRQGTLQRQLRILTNVAADVSVRQLGLDFGKNTVHIERWTPQGHLAALQSSKVALDIKGNDFRQRHKPPTKAVDFIASGLPVAVNHDSSVAQFLHSHGFDVATPHESDRWFSHDYWKQTQQLGESFRQRYSIATIAAKLSGIIEAALRDRRRRGQSLTASL